MNLVEVVILLGAQCLSPMEQGPGLTVVGKVPCAVLIRHDPPTAAVEIVPPSAATDPAPGCTNAPGCTGVPAGSPPRSSASTKARSCDEERGR